MTVWTRALIGAALAALCLVPSWTRARAAGLTGDTLTGTLNFCSLGGSGNAFSTGSGTAPVTFIHDEGPEGANTDSAEFTDTTLTVQDIVGEASTSCGWGMQFTDTTTPYPSLTLLSSSFTPDFSYDLTDGVITIGWTGTDTSGTYTAVFNIDGALPEPGTMATFGLALAGIGLIRGKRRSG